MAKGLRTLFIMLFALLVLGGGFLLATDPRAAIDFVQDLVAVPKDEFKGGLTTSRQDYSNGWSVIRRADGSISKIERQYKGRTHGPFFIFSPLGHLKTSTFNRDGTLLTIRNVGLDVPKWVVPFVKYSYYYHGPPPYGVLLSHLEERVKNERPRIADLLKEIQSIPAPRQLSSKKPGEVVVDPAQEKKDELIALLVSGIPDFSAKEFEIVAEPSLGQQFILSHTINVKTGGTRYLGLVTIDLATKGYPFNLHGPFVMGEILKSKAGKAVWPGQNIFVRFDTCPANEKCQPWTFAYAASLTPKGEGMPYVFIYGKNHEYYEPGLEINLPNEGLSSEGKVEARFLPHPEDPGSMIFLQEFRYGDFKKGRRFVERDREFFTFYCKDFVCDHRMTSGTATLQFEDLWSKATFLSKR